LNSGSGGYETPPSRTKSTQPSGHRREPQVTRKDLGLAQELARAAQTPMPLGALCEQEMAEAMARGWADHDASIFLTLQEERAKVQVRLPPG
jgi:3-hydroxyisobutyrate dehydrogenase-like beta-hydroxyacid dehydrogenase